jgi:glycosyltransferase involved in cell wall biosynthesis
LPRIVEELSGRPGADWELLLVDDGSTDRTGEIMEEFARGRERVRVLHHRRNFGQGRALRTAFDQARGETIVTLDADLSYGPEYIFRLADALETHNVEIALASPYAAGGTVRNVPFYRHFLSRVGNLYLARMSHYRVSTSTCVVRAYRREVLDALSLTSDGMELQLEILMKAAMLNFRACEVPAELAWDTAKAKDADIRRVSKMRILRTIRLYLMLGWLQRPALLFVVVGLLLVVPGAYMALALLVRLLQGIGRHVGEGASQAVSSALEDVFRQHTYSLAFCGAFLLIGFQLLIFAMVLLQNKFYFEELFRLGQNRRDPRRRDG